MVKRSSSFHSSAAGSYTHDEFEDSWSEFLRTATSTRHSAQNAVHSEDASYVPSNVCARSRDSSMTVESLLNLYTAGKIAPPAWDDDSSSAEEPTPEEYISDILHNVMTDRIIFGVFKKSKRCIAGFRILDALHKFVDGQIPCLDPETGEEVWYKNDKSSSRRLLKNRRGFLNIQIPVAEFENISKEHERAIWTRAHHHRQISIDERMFYIESQWATMVHDVTAQFQEDFNRTLLSSVSTRLFYIIARLALWLATRSYSTNLCASDVLALLRCQDGDRDRYLVHNQLYCLLEELKSLSDFPGSPLRTASESEIVLTGVLFDKVGKHLTRQDVLRAISSLKDRAAESDTDEEDEGGLETMLDLVRWLDEGETYREPIMDRRLGISEPKPRNRIYKRTREDFDATQVERPAKRLRPAAYICPSSRKALRPLPRRSARTIVAPIPIIKVKTEPMEIQLTESYTPLPNCQLSSEAHDDSQGQDITLELDNLGYPEQWAAGVKPYEDGFSRQDTDSSTLVSPSSSHQRSPSSKSKLLLKAPSWFETVASTFGPLHSSPSSMSRSYEDQSPRPIYASDFQSNTLTNALGLSFESSIW